MKKVHSKGYEMVYLKVLLTVLTKVVLRVAWMACQMELRKVLMHHFRIMMLIHYNSQVLDCCDYHILLF